MLAHHHIHKWWYPRKNHHLEGLRQQMFDFIHKNLVEYQQVVNILNLAFLMKH
jgi:hypothetical protein